LTLFVFTLPSGSKTCVLRHSRGDGFALKMISQAEGISREEDTLCNASL